MNKTECGFSETKYCHYLCFQVSNRTNRFTASSGDRYSARQKELHEYIKSLHDSGMSYRRITKLLNKKGIKTHTGPLDILAQRKDKSEFMVLELKRDKLSDNAVSQTLRYINFVRRTLAANGEEVKGCIIGTEEDRALMNAIAEVPNIDFYRYNISFSLDLVNR